MARRKKPAAGSRFSSGGTGDPSVHLAPFIHYLEAECGLAQNTLKAYRADLIRFFAWNTEHGTSSVKEIDIKVLSGYMEHLQKAGLAASSIARHLVAIRMFFRYLVLEGVLLESSVELMNSPKLWEYLPRVLSPEAVDRLLTAPNRADTYWLRDRAILAVMYATGCRVSEVTGLKLRDLNLDEAYCRCLGKGNKERVVSLSAVAIDAVADYLKDERPKMVQRGECEFLFVTRSGNQMSRVMVWNLVRKYAIKAGCSGDVTPHTLRHSFATHMLAGGAEIRALQEMLGHASIRTTQIYTHVEHSRLKSVHKQCHPRG
jgi:integrase/recombinase XerD